MLDKSIPFYHVIMKRSAGTPIPNWVLPNGYSFTGFEEGKEDRWAEIEAAVGEFASVSEGLHYFKGEYLPFRDELHERLMFVVNDSGQYAGTVTSWWNEGETGRVPSLHWFAVKPEYQGVGLGKALVSECLRRFQALEGEQDVYLHTQTWSYRAIHIYLQAGFRFAENESFAHYRNETTQALPLLKSLLTI